jgi:hypothetical protein
MARPSPQVGVTILSQKSTRSHRLFVYDSNKQASSPPRPPPATDPSMWGQGLATGELSEDLGACVQSEVSSSSPPSTPAPVDS